MLNNLFKDTSKSLIRASLALRALIGTVATAAYVQNDVRLAFWFLVAGAGLDFVIQLLPPDTKIKPGAKILVVLVSVALIWFSGCKTLHPATSSVVVTDTTVIKYKPVDVTVKGAKVTQAVNVDSLFGAWLATSKEYSRDSAKAVKAGKPIPPAPVAPARTVSDPQTKAQLTYWIDQFGKLQVSCESKDQTVQILVAEINRLRHEVKTVVKTEYKTPNWNYVVIVLLAAALVLTIIKR